MPEPKNPAAAEGGLLSHLIELRNRLLYALLAVGVVFGGLLPFANEIYVALAKPLMDVLPQGAGMIATEVASPFLTPIKLALILAIVLAVPFILHQLWAFVAPGLYRRERRLVLPLLISSTALFYAGMAFAYFVVFPLAFGFFVGSVPPGVTVMTDIKSYMDFIFSMFLAFGVAFEVPVAVVLLARMGAVDPAQLGRKRPYVVLWVFIAAAVLTPPDVLSQIFLAVPMLILFEIGLFFARRVTPADAQGMSAEEAEAEFDRHERELARAGKKGRK